MAIKKASSGNPDDAKKKLDAARSRKSQAKPKPDASQPPSSAAAVSAGQIKQTEEEFGAFKTALTKKLVEMHRHTAAVAEQAAEINHSMPAVFEEAFMRKKAELEASGTGHQSFPAIGSSPEPAFDLKESVRSAVSGSTSKPAITGSDATPRTLGPADIH